MGEIRKRARFVTDFYGGKAYLPGDEIIQMWLDNLGEKLAHPKFRELNKARKSDTKMEEILSVFNMDENGCPIIGNWMLKECSMDAQKLAGTWNRWKVSFDAWKDSVQITPNTVEVHRNGDRVTQADGVEAYTIVPKRTGRKSGGFFKTYQTIRSGAEFEFTITFPDDLCMKVEEVKKGEENSKDKIFVPDIEKTLECVNAVLDKMCIVGTGAYRLRFGKFEYID